MKFNSFEVNTVVSIFLIAITYWFVLVLLKKASFEELLQLVEVILKNIS